MMSDGHGAGIGEIISEDDANAALSVRTTTRRMWLNIAKMDGAREIEMLISSPELFYRYTLRVFPVDSFCPRTAPSPLTAHAQDATRKSNETTNLNYA